jgi:hypothetical protein
MALPLTVDYSDAIPASHLGRRLNRFQAVRLPQLEKRTRMEARRSAASLGRAITIPCEFDDLGVSIKPKRERRVYRHEELVQLGVRTVKWDGRSVYPFEPRMASKRSPLDTVTLFPF